MKYLILEQKYFELIEDNQLMDALYCLRNEIRSLNIRIERTHQLTTYLFNFLINSKDYFFYSFSFLMFNSLKDMHKAANWSGKGFISRENLMEKLQSTFPPSLKLNLL